MTLVFDEWYTEATGHTDQHGQFRTHADLGRYRVVVETDNERKTVTRSLTDPDGTAEWTIRM